MTTFNSDTVCGLAISAAAIFSFIATSDVSAETTFPPLHHDRGAEFNEPAEVSSIGFQGPWYRPTTDIPPRRVEFTQADSRISFVLTERSIGPWYRAAN